MGNRRRIKRGAPSQGARVTAQNPPDYNKQPPVFSLEKLQTGKYCLSNLDRDDKAQFAEAMFRRKQMTWNEIHRDDHHALGTEKIERNSIKASTENIAEDADIFIAFRYNGKKPMVGYRLRNIFFVLWFDHDFTLYDH